MRIDRDEVRRIAELARLEIADDDAAAVAGQLSGVLDFVATLQQLDLDGCEPSTFAPAGAPPREDVPGVRGLDPFAATAAAPESDEGYFVVPPVVENVNP